MNKKYNLRTGDSIAFIDLPYPYGGKHPYFNGSAATAAAQFVDAGFQVFWIDLNIDPLKSEYVQRILNNSSAVAISVVGAPSIPNAKKLSNYLLENYPEIFLYIGGAVIEGISQECFTGIFSKNTIRACRVEDILGLGVKAWRNVSLRPIWEKLPKRYQKEYLSRTIPLVISIGCKFKCNFCAVPGKGKPEVFKNLAVFHIDTEMFLESADEFGIHTVNMYASILDLFQSMMGKEHTIMAYIDVLATLNNNVEYSSRISWSALTTLISLRIAYEKGIEGFAERIQASGLKMIGGGADGTLETIWKKLKKRHNQSLEDVFTFIAICKELKVTPDVLMVMGFPHDTFASMFSNMYYSLLFGIKYRAMVHMYVAKNEIPLNDNWGRNTEMLIAKEGWDWRNLDFGMLGSRLTHPRLFHRWMVNSMYILTWVILTLIKASNTPVYFPYIFNDNIFAKIINYFFELLNKKMPPDR